MKAEDRIKQDAEEALKEVEGSNLDLWPIKDNEDERNYWKEVYGLGALAERNKTIEEVKILHQRYLNLQIGTEGTSFEQLLESLKV